MEKDTRNNTHDCYACGATRPEADMRAFGHDEHLGVVSWVCVECEQPARKVISGQPKRVLVHGRPALSFKTLATAERLVREGYGWSADQVMRKALTLLEAERSKLVRQ